jgi:F-type H+-transporting ATPase subunit gamma
MTERLREISAQIHDVTQLETVIGAMRGIAAARAQQSRGLLAGVRSYAAVVAQAIAQALRLLPEDPESGRHVPGGRMGVILFTAEQGFAGAFSDRMLEAARPLLVNSELFLIGSRGGMLADERHVQVAWRTRMAMHPDGAAAVAERICEALYFRLPDRHLTRVELVFPTWVPGSGLVPCTRSLLPLDRQVFTRLQVADIPLTTIPPALLLQRLAEEYVYAILCEAATEAYVAENEARVASMAAAKTNIEHNLDALRSRERLVRQEEITAEVVELAGFRSEVS